MKMSLHFLKVLHYLLLLSLINDSDNFTYPKDLHGNSCGLEDGRRGVCKKVTDCPEKVKEIIEGKRNHLSNDHCSFENRNEIVCCPLTDNLIEKRIADKVCDEFERLIFSEDTQMQINVVHGVEVMGNEFPFMAALGYENEDNNTKYLCGGTLISSNFVLTAGHCIINVNDNKPVEVRLGSEYLLDFSSNVQKILVDKMYPYPNFNIGTHYNDIALLKLKNPASITKYVRPACLQTNSVLSLNTRNDFIVASGFGATSFENEGSNALMKTANLSLVKSSQCNTKYRGLRKLPRGIDDSMLCYIDPSKTNRSDACQGDSGGPLVMVNEFNNSIRLIGVTSFGDFCGGPVPGVYTAVYNYLEWIENIVWGNDS